MWWKIFIVVGWALVGVLNLRKNCTITKWDYILVYIVLMSYVIGDLVKIFIQ